MRVTVDDVRLFFDVEGCGLAARGTEMAGVFRQAPQQAFALLRAFLPDVSGS